MDFLSDARRRAFSVWLRTGRLPRWARRRAAEVKFNPWHDPDDGRFTFAGTGRYFGRGTSGGRAAGRLEAGMSRGRRTPFGGYGGGNSGGAGASGDWPAPEPDSERPPQRGNTGSQDRASSGAAPSTTRRARPAIDNPRNWRRVEANGYTYRIDALGRTRRVTGTITENRTQSRSRTAQMRAGGADRRSSDHGGHYIARRFNKTVEVRIVPVYEGSSSRPSRIIVSYWMDGVHSLARFPNEPRERTNAKR
jgi:hypothetical protein